MADALLCPATRDNFEEQSCHNRVVVSDYSMAHMAALWSKFIAWRGFTLNLGQKSKSFNLKRKTQKRPAELVPQKDPRGILRKRPARGHPAQEAKNLTNNR
jgi:hypothetical protein